MSWSSAVLVRHNILQDLAFIEQSKAIKLNGVADNSTAIVCKDLYFLDIMKAVLNYPGKLVL